MTSPNFSTVGIPQRTEGFDARYSAPRPKTAQGLAHDEPALVVGNSDAVRFAFAEFLVHCVAADTSMKSSAHSRRDICLCAVAAVSL